MKVAGKRDADDLARRRRRGGRDHRPDAAAARIRRTRGCATLAEAARAIRDMQVRGAPLIGAAAAYGIALAMRQDPSDAGLEGPMATLAATRPTAVNLRWALDEMRRRLAPLPPATRGRRRMAARRAKSPTRMSRSTAPSASTGCR